MGTSHSKRREQNRGAKSQQANRAREGGKQTGSESGPHSDMSNAGRGDENRNR
jgi:hypothetical protein